MDQNIDVVLFNNYPKELAGHEDKKESILKYKISSLKKSVYINDVYLMGSEAYYNKIDDCRIINSGNSTISKLSTLLKNFNDHKVALYLNETTSFSSFEFDQYLEKSIENFNDKSVICLEVPRVDESIDHMDIIMSPLILLNTKNIPSEIGEFIGVMDQATKHKISKDYLSVMRKNYSNIDTFIEKFVLDNLYNCDLKSEFEKIGVKYHENSLNDIDICSIDDYIPIRTMKELNSAYERIKDIEKFSLKINRIIKDN